MSCVSWKPSFWIRDPVLFKCWALKQLWSIAGLFKYSALQSQYTVSAHLKSEQILPFGFARQYCLAAKGELFSQESSSPVEPVGVAGPHPYSSRKNFSYLQIGEKESDPTPPPSKGQVYQWHLIIRHIRYVLQQIEQKPNTRKTHQLFIGFTSDQLISGLMYVSGDYMQWLENVHIQFDLSIPKCYAPYTHLPYSKALLLGSATSRSRA